MNIIYQISNQDYKYFNNIVSQVFFLLLLLLMSNMLYVGEILGPANSLHDHKRLALTTAFYGKLSHIS